MVENLTLLMSFRTILQANRQKWCNTMALIGYGRVSKQEQHLELQLDKLREKGCSKIFTDKISGAKFEREQLEAALAYLRQGDTLVVWKLDRLGRSLRHLIDTVMELQKRGIGFISLRQGSKKAKGT